MACKHQRTTRDQFHADPYDICVQLCEDASEQGCQGCIGTLLLVVK